MLTNHLKRAGVVVASVCLTACLAFAQKAPPAHLRGSVVSYDGVTLRVNSREGQTVDVALADGWKISSVANAEVDSIKPGDYVGIASLPGADGDQAIEVLIFPPALRGLGEGNHGYDLKPNSSMTNASVTNFVKGVNGRVITLSYNGGQQKTITITPDTPVVKFAPATPEDLKPGAPVFVVEDPSSGDNAKVSSHQVVVGTNGVVPPM